MQSLYNIKHVTITVNIINKCVNVSISSVIRALPSGYRASGICGVAFFNMMYEDTVHYILNFKKIK